MFCEGGQKGEVVSIWPRAGGGGARAYLERRVLVDPDVVDVHVNGLRRVGEVRRRSGSAQDVRCERQRAEEDAPSGLETSEVTERRGSGASAAGGIRGAHRQSKGGRRTQDVVVVDRGERERDGEVHDDVPGEAKGASGWSAPPSGTQTASPVGRETRRTSALPGSGGRRRRSRSGRACRRPCTSTTACRSRTR